LAALPAASLAEPVALCAALSPRVCFAEQLSTPDRLSAHEKLTSTSALYQPSALAARSAAALMVGGVLSMLTVAGSLAELPALSSAVPATDCSAPSVVTDFGLVQEATPETPSAHVNVMVTSVLFQPTVLAAGDWLCVIVGGVLSILTWTVLAASVLPALSTLQNCRLCTPSALIATLVPACWAPASNLKKVFATPESPSLASRVTVTSLLFQFAGAVALVVGAVLSILTAGLLVLLVVLPALSATEVLAVRPVPSLLMVLSAGVLPARPDRASEAVQWMVTLPLYQPAPFGLLVGAP